MIDTTTRATTTPPSIFRELKSPVHRACEECGYDLRGIAADAACPECGHPAAESLAKTPPELTWARTVFVGLALLLAITLYAVCSVLIQPNETGLASTPAALNFPGPKLWAIPLLQRPIGRTPELPGVMGTRTAMLSLLGIWLITAPLAAPAGLSIDKLRTTTRWVSAFVFGLGFGAMLAREGLWPSELPPFRLVLVAVVELPGGALLYLYLRELSRFVPGRDRREQFDRLVFFVPGVIVMGAVLLGMGWYLVAHRQDELNNRNLQLTASAVYGTLAMACGVAATGAVGALAAGYFRLGFPDGHRWLSVVRYGHSRIRQVARAIEPTTLRRLAVAAGLVMLIIATISGCDEVLWMIARRGVGGNLPFVNFAGPRIWCAASLTEMRGGDEWEPLLSQTTQMLAQLLALYLISTPLLSTPRARSDMLRGALRWLPPILIGMAIFTVNSLSAIPTNRWSDEDAAYRMRSHFFAGVTIACELPPTLLLYALLSRLARELGQPRLARQFRQIAAAIVFIVALAMGAFAISRYLAPFRTAPLALAVGAAYGAFVLTISLAATVLVFRLIGVLVWTKEKPSACEGLHTLSM